MLYKFSVKYILQDAILLSLLKGGDIVTGAAFTGAATADMCSPIAMGDEEVKVSSATSLLLTVIVVFPLAHLTH